MTKKNIILFSLNNMKLINIIIMKILKNMGVLLYLNNKMNIKVYIFEIVLHSLNKKYLKINNKPKILII